jgi:dTDP-4-amino-4,6-dideoxygalactose transaminase
MGLVNLDALPGFVEANKRSHDRYASLLSGVSGVRLLAYNPATTPNYHYAVVELEDVITGKRDEIVAALQAENILARKYFWPGCHGMKPYRDLYPHARLMLPNTERVANRVIVLPNGPSVGDEHATIIASVFEALLGRF